MGIQLEQSDVDELLKRLALEGIDSVSEKTESKPLKRAERPQQKQSAGNVVVKTATPSTKEIIGKCPHCSLSWDFPVDRNGRIGLIPDHFLDGILCSGSRKSPVHICLSSKDGYNAKKHNENVVALRSIRQK